MHRRSLVALGALTLAACAGPLPSPVATPDGRWDPVAATLGGAALPVAAFAGARLELAGDRYTFGTDRGAIVWRPTTAPAQLDVHGREGPNAGRVIPAIYALRADELVVCYQLGDGPRPTAFESPAGSRVLLIRYRRL